MIVSALLVAAVSAGPPLQQQTRAGEIQSLALAGAADLAAEVRAFPDAARDAFEELLRAAGATPRSPRSLRALDGARTLGAAYFEAWMDPFYVREAGRFGAWSPAQRRARLEADSLRRGGNEAFASSGVESATRLWRRSLTLSERLSDTVGVARALGNLGAGSYAAGDLATASGYLSRAYDRAVAVGDLRTAASAVTNLASISYDRGEYSQAARLYANSLGLLRRTGDVRVESVNRHNLALVYIALGDLESARISLEESIRLSRLHGHRKDEAEGLSVLADLALSEGRYAEAATTLESSLELSRSTGNRIAEAGGLHSRGLLNAARGAYREADADIARAVELYHELGLVTDEAEARVDRATVLGAIGEIRDGLSQLRGAKALVRAGDPPSPLEADIALAGGDLHALLNDYEAAANDYERAYRAFERTNDVGGRIQADLGRGLMEMTRKDWSKAAERFRRAAEAEPFVIDPRTYAITRMYLAHAVAEIGDTDKAKTILAASRRHIQPGEDPVINAALLGAQADVEANELRNARADSLYRTALETLGDREVPEIAWRLHAGLADVLGAQNHKAPAEDHLEQAVATVERGAVGVSKAGRSAYLRDKSDIYVRLAALQASRNDAGATFVTSERLRAGRTLATLSRGRTGRVDESSSLRTREQDLRRRMIAISTRLYPTLTASTAHREPSAAAHQSSADLEAALRQTQDDYAEVLGRIRRDDPDYAAAVAPDIPTVNQVASRLRRDEALVEYLVSDSATLAVVVTSSRSTVLTLSIGREPLSDLISFARGAVERRRTGETGDLWVSPLRRLYRELVAPVYANGILTGTTKLIIVPHVELHYLPFQALITSPDRIEFLVERTAIVYAPSAAIWLRLSDRRRQGASATVLALAPRTSELPGSGFEVRRISEIYGNRAASVTDGKATEQTLRERAGEFDILHLATFGRMNPANPLFSWLDLSPTDSDDGRLEVHEIYGLELRARLVVLSACETALGIGSQTNAPAGDDWVSLARAFLTAGADNVVASLWRVEDLATARLMERFYRTVEAGEPFADALVAAQRSLLDDPATAHPFFWAGFALVGEGGASP